MRGRLGNKLGVWCSTPVHLFGAPGDIGVRGIMRRDGVAIVVSQSLRLLIYVGTTWSVTHLLDPAEFGRLMLCTASLVVLRVFEGGGLGEAVARSDTLDSGEASAYVIISTAIGLVIAVSVIASMPLIESLTDSAGLVPLGGCFGAAIVLNGARNTYRAAFRRLALLSHLGLVELAAGICSGLALVGFAWAFRSAMAVPVSQAVNVLVELLLLAYLARWMPGRPSFSAKVWRGFRFGLQIVSAGLAASVIKSASILVLGTCFEERVLGIIERVSTLTVGIVERFSELVNRFVVPALLSAQAGGRFPFLLKRYLAVGTLLWLPAWLLIAISAAIAGPSDLLFLGSEVSALLLPGIVGLMLWLPLRIVSAGAVIMGMGRALILTAILLALPNLLALAAFPQQVEGFLWARAAWEVLLAIVAGMILLRRLCSPAGVGG